MSTTSPSAAAIADDHSRPPQRIPRLEQVDSGAVQTAHGHPQFFNVNSDSDDSDDINTHSPLSPRFPCTTTTQSLLLSQPSPLESERGRATRQHASTECPATPSSCMGDHATNYASTVVRCDEGSSKRTDLLTSTVTTGDATPTVTATLADQLPTSARGRLSAEQPLAQRHVGDGPTSLASPLPQTSLYPARSAGSLLADEHPATSNGAREWRRQETSAAAATEHRAVSDSDVAEVEVVEPPPVLSDEQNRTMTLVVDHGRSVFITGGAGTGKSFLLRKLITALPRSTTFVTATTGIAALNLGGTTLHSFAGCGLVERGADRREVFHRVRGRAKVRKNWQNCQVLIIDEVSMLDPWFFDVLDYVARRIRNNRDAPFGGIQLVLSGDFLQLPPVIKIAHTHARSADSSAHRLFCFESESWLAVNPAICLLTKAFRQRDRKFFQMLSEMRMGLVSSMTLTRLQALSSANTVNFVSRVSSCDQPGVGAAVGVPHVRLAYEDGSPQESHFDGYTILRPKRDEVERENSFYYSQLTTEEIMYQGIHSGQGRFDEKALPKLVRLRQGCRVMLIKNFDASLGLVNGSTGTVTHFMDASRGYRTRNESITMHDICAIGVGRDQDMTKRHVLLPVVAFEVRRRDGSSGTREVVVEPQEWKEMQGDTCVSRTVQMPLILAYAITIHKSQGMSLTHVDIDFRNIFETGQAYVALSRCTDLKHTRLHSFGALAVQPNPIALSYYKALDYFVAARQWRRQHTPGEAACRPPLTSRTSDATNALCATDCDDLDEDEDGVLSSFTPYGYCTPPRLDADGLIDTEDDNEQASAVAVRTPPQSPTMQIESLRKRILPATQQADRVQQIVCAQMVNATRVRGGRLIMDVTAFFDLITGAHSVAQYQQIFETNGNCMRVPQAVLQKLSEVAEYRLSCYTGHLGGAQLSTPTDRKEKEQDDISSYDDHGSEDDELLQASNVAAEALRLIEKAKGDFSLDVQREGESVPLPRCLPSWMQFADALPLLREASSANEGDPQSCDRPDELAFLLNRDPREIPQHAEILRYALFLRHRFGSQSFVLCTNSPTLAAYGLAYDFKVAHIAHGAP